MTGPVTVSSSCPKIGSNDEAQRATLSPPLILTSNGHSDLTEKPSSKSNPNPISPADEEDDDDAKFVKGTNLTQENEQALKDMTRNVLNASENYGVEKFGVTADVEPKPNFILDGQEVKAKLSINDTESWFARRVPKFLSIGRQNSSKGISSPSNYSQWMSPPRNFHPMKRNWKSPSLLETSLASEGTPDESKRGTVVAGQGGLEHINSSSNVMQQHSYRPSPPPRKRISQKTTPSPFRSRSLSAFFEPSLKLEVSTPCVEFPLEESALGSFSPMGFQSESQQGSFSNLSPNRYFPAHLGPQRPQINNSADERAEINSKPPKNRSPFSRFISMFNSDSFDIEPVRSVTKIQGQQHFQNPPNLHQALVSISPQASPIPFTVKKNNYSQTPPDKKAYSPMPNLEKIRRFNWNAGSKSGSTILKLGQNMNSLETRKCFEGINSSMQRESQSLVVETSNNLMLSNVDNAGNAMIAREALAFSSSNALCRNMPQTQRISPPSPPVSTRQRNHPPNDFFYEMGAHSTHQGPVSVPVAMASMHEGYIPYTPQIPQLPPHFYNQGHLRSEYKPGKTDQIAYKQPNTPTPSRHIPDSANLSGGNKENIISSSGPPSGGKNNPCNCKKSKCLKLYCECFAAEKFCFGCNCTDCWNTPQHEQFRNEQIRVTKLKNPQAFTPRVHIDQSGNTNNTKHTTGCKCKKSACLKKYCECFEAGVNCGDKCKCVDCKNFPGSQALVDRRSKMKAAKITQAADDDGLWRLENAPGSGNTAGSAEGPASSRVQREPLYDYPQQYPYPCRYPEDKYQDYQDYHRNPHGSHPASISPKHRPCYPTPHPYISHGPPFTGDQYPQNHTGFGMLSQSFQPINMTPTMMYNSHSSSATQTNNKTEVRHPMPPSFPPHYNAHHHMPYYGYPAAPTPVSQSIQVRSTSERLGSKKNNTPKLTTPTATVATRLNFDPAKSKTAKRLQPGDMESTSSTFGARVPEQPKTMTLAIFSFLSNADLYNASLVSKEWSKLATDPELWKFSLRSGN